MEKVLYKEDTSLQEFGHEIVRDFNGIITAFHFTEEVGVEERKSITKYNNVKISKPSIYKNIYDKTVYFIGKSSIASKINKTYGIRLSNENFASEDEINYKLLKKFYNRIHNFDIDISFVIKEVLEDDLVLADLTVETTSYYCKKCGHRFTSYKSPFMTTKSMTDKIVLYNDEDKIALSVSYKEMLYKEIDEKVLKPYYRSYKDKWIFKKDTEMFYIINNLSNTGSTHLCRKNPKRIRNISNTAVSTTMSTEKFYQESFKYLLEKYPKEIEYIHKDLVSMIDDKNTRFCMIIPRDFETIKTVNCDSQIMIYIYKILMIKVKYNVRNTALALMLTYLKGIRPDLLKKIKDLNDKETLKLLGINNKDVLDIVSSCGSKCYCYYLFIIGLVKDKNIYRETFRKTFDLYNENLTLPDIKRFFRVYKKNNTDKTFIRKITECSNYILDDTVNMYTKIRSMKPKYEIDTSNKITQIHDYLSEDYNKLKIKNKKISKNKFLAEAFKNSNFDGIEYKLAKETHELVSTGSKMCICVGSYGEKAVKKHCFIVIGYKDNEPVTCMEFIKADEEFRCVQIKKSRNYLAKPDEQQYLVDLFEKNNINYKTCYDITLNKEEKEYVGNYVIN